MAQTDYTTLEDRRPGDRTTMQVLYGLHTVAPVTLWSLSVIALIVNYVKRSDEPDPLFLRHHAYMIRTFWWSMFWLVLTSPLYLLLFLPGVLAWTVVGAWYLYRCILGWMRFNDNRLPD
jgi:uncharacterized membrane protein